MLLSVWNTSGSVAQLLAMLVVFILVLLLTLLTTRWIAKFEKSKCTNRNIEVMETCRITSNKYIQIIRLGDTYAAIAVCKDTVTMLISIPKEQIEFPAADGSTSLNFKELLDKAAKMFPGKDRD